MKQFRIPVIHKVVLAAICCLTGLFVLDAPVFCEVQKRVRAGSRKVIQLPAPNLSGSVSLEQAINTRRSVRRFADKSLSFIQMGQLAWAGQGITDKQSGHRAAPSAWALYPIELYLVAPEGQFVYRPESHSLEQVTTEDLRSQLSAAVGQGTLAEAACDIVIAGSAKKLTPKVGNKASRFMLLEAGHVAENIQLQAVSLGLASVPVGSFETKNVSKACGLTGNLEPLMIVCVGYPLAQSQDGKTSGEKKRAVLVVPSANFSDEELFETRRVLNAAGIETVIASSKTGPLQGVQKGLAASEMTLDNVRVDDFDAVVFVGGPGATEYYINSAALGIAREAATKHKAVAAISTAPTILAAAGVLRGVRATGFITQREIMRKGQAIYTGNNIERDGMIITASNSSVVVPFAQAIARAIQEKPPKQ